MGSDLNADKKSARERVTREDLYNLVWSEPMLKVAARYGVSSSYMARVCTHLNVPRPGRGYWAKLAVGKAPKVPELPPARPGDELVWSYENDGASIERALPKPPTQLHKRTAKKSFSVASEHELVRGVKAYFENGRLSYDSAYLKPSKKLLLDLAVTQTGLDKALSLANQLFLALERKGHRVIIAPSTERFQRHEVSEREDQNKKRGYSDLWTPGRCTVVYIGSVAIGLSIIEMSEEVEARYVNGKYIRESEYVPPKQSRYMANHTWTTQKDFSTGRLCLQAYSPYFRAKWVKQWRETKNSDLANRIPQIINELEQNTIDIARLVEEGERKAEIERKQWEAQYEKWQKEERERKAAQALKESKEELLQIIKDWVEARNIEEFFKVVEQDAAALSSEEKHKFQVRISRARELFGDKKTLEKIRSWKLPEDR